MYVSPRVSKQKTRKLLDRVREIEGAMNEVKPLYSEMDEIITELQRRDDVARNGAVIVDEYSGKNTVFKSVGIRRYTIKWENES